MRSLSFLATSLTLSLLISPPLYAQDTAQHPRIFAVGVSGGTLGLGVEASYRILDKLVLRGAISGYNLNVDQTIFSFGDAEVDDFNFDVRGFFAGAMLDWHPYGSGLRLTGGFRYAKIDFDSLESDGGHLGTNLYTFAQVGEIHRTVSNSNPLAPYLGIGYDVAHFNRENSTLTFALDFGALYAGDPDVSVKTTNSVAGLASDLALETETLRSDLEKYYRFYPVFMVSGKIAF
jgi:hypothetical protein